MSTDDFGERTQKPTERRRREARARGEVARSADLVSSSVLLGAAAALWYIAPGLGRTLGVIMRDGLSTNAPMPLTIELATRLLTGLAARLTPGLSSLLLILVAMAALANLIQSGFLWTPQNLLPRFERLDPARGLQRWVSLDTWMSLLAGGIKLSVLVLVLIAFAQLRLSSLRGLATSEPLELFSLAAHLMAEFGLLLSLSLFVLALLDYGYQFWRHEQRLMMTVEEVRREQREDETDPRLRRARRDMATEAATRINGV